MTGVAGSFGAVQWAPKDAAVYNPAFDVTPAALISGWVLDSGVVTRSRWRPGRLRRKGLSQSAVIPSVYG